MELLNMNKINNITKSFLLSQKNKPADIEARIQALDITESYIVKAPAGSGKTELLSQRFLALLSVVSEPEEILAITFTNKASYEMRARIIGFLQLAESNQKPTESHELLSWRLAKSALAKSEEKGWDLLTNPNRLKIKTIDSFYGSLARRAPISGLIGGGLRIADNYSECYIKAAREVLNDLEIDNDWTASLEAVLSHVDNRFDRAEQLMVSLLEKREHWLPIVLSSRNTTNLRETLESCLKSIVSDLISSVSASIKIHSPVLLELADFASKNLDPDKSANLLPLCNLSENKALPGSSATDVAIWKALGHFLLTRQGTLRKSATSAIGFPAPSKVKNKVDKAVYSARKNDFKELLASLVEDSSATKALALLRTLPPTEYEDQEWCLLEHLLTLLPILAAKLLLVFQRDGVLDHSEIASSALRVLGDSDNPTDLALVLDAQLKHVLIDEIQDTNNLQMTGLELITAGWEYDDGRTIFLVGDPMQSIYGFRGSNVGLYIDVEKNGISDVSLTPLDLTVNFRSQEKIVQWVNSSFTSIFPRSQDSNLGAIPYSESTSFLGSLPGEAVVATGFSGAPAATREAEGQWIAKQILKIRSDFPSDSTAILVKNRSHLISIIKALLLEGIPFQAIDIDQLKNRRVIRELTSLSRALCHLGDRTAWLALLRSTLVGLDLEELECVSEGGNDTLIWENLRNARIIDTLQPETQSRINRLVSTMQNSMRWRDRKSLSIIVEGAWIDLCGPATIQEEQDLENVQSYFATLKQFTFSSFDTYAFESILDGLYAKPEMNGYNPIQVMTLHKSKGLQFDHVFIPGCDRSSRPDDTRLLAWDRYTSKNGTEAPLLSASTEIGGSSNELYNFISTQQSNRTKLERERILYVGCTRAIKTLYLTWCQGINKEGEAKKPSKTSFAGALWSSISEQMTVYAIKEKCHILDSGLSQGICSSQKLEISKGAPELPHGNILSAYRGMQAVNNSQLPELQWVVDYKAHFGTLFHRILRRICLDGIDVWLEFNLNDRKASWCSQLIQSGVPPYLAPTYANRIIDTINILLNEDKARWILQNIYEESSCELRITNHKEGFQEEFIIDRTFIDDGTRWVIDYKTSQPHKEETIISFKNRMKTEHQEKLEHYASLFTSLGSEPVRYGIYLTAIQEFVEFLPNAIDAAA